YKDDLVAEQAQITASTQLLRAQFSAREITATEYYTRMRELVQQSNDAQQQSIQRQIDYLKEQSVSGKESITVNRQLGELEARLARQRIEGATALELLKKEEEKTAKARENALKAYGDALDASNAALQRQRDTMVAGVGMGDRQYEIQQRINDAYADQVDKLRELTRQRDASELTGAEFEERRATLMAKSLDRLQLIKDGYEDLRLAEGNWLAGAGAAWANYQQEAGNYARQMGDTVTT
ncbi:phage tail tape measure protein, partial [Stenotrophomonas lactitubi]